MLKKNTIEALEQGNLFYGSDIWNLIIEIQSLKDSIAAEQYSVDAANQRVVEKKLRSIDLNKQQVSEKNAVAKSKNELAELDRRYIM